jgi:alpha-amylase
MKKLFVLFPFFYLFSFCLFGQDLRDLPFSWDNASVYFVITDRFNNGDPSNDQSYGRGFDGNGNPYQFDEVGSFHGGDIKGLNQKISEGYFTDLGINALWITAPYEQIHGWVAGANGSFQHYAYHGYYPLDWTEMDQNMGTKDEFREFVDNAHDHGIRVVLDIVLNHAGYNTAHDMEEYNFGCLDNGWRGWRPSGGQNWNNIHDFIGYEGCSNWSNWWSGEWVRAGLPGYPAPGHDDFTMALAGLPDVITEKTTHTDLPPVLLNKWSQQKLNQEMTELDAFFNRTGFPRTPRHYIIKWLTDWVREFGIDGFRVDTEKHVEGEAWRLLKQEAVLALREWKAANPHKKIDDLDFWMTAETYGMCSIGRSQYHVDNGFDSAINFCFQNQAGNPSQYESLFSNYAANINNDPQWNVLSYISSHDTHLFDRNNLYNAATSMMLLPGGVQIFYGDETGRQFGPTAQDPEQGTRSFMNWNSIDQNLLEHWQKLGQFRRNHLSVGAGQHEQIGSNPYTFKREYGDDMVVVAIGASGSVSLNVGSVFPDGTEVRDFYSGYETVVQNGSVSIPAHSQGIILLENAGDIVQLPVVSINPSGGHYTDPVEISISATSEFEPIHIYYTLDGSNPTLQSPVYSGPFVLEDDAVVKAIAIDAENLQSRLAQASYTVGQIQGFTVHFKKPANWGNNVRIHHWDAVPEGSLDDSAWPGVPMIAGANDWYSFQIDGVLSANLLFHDGAGGQTPDLSRAGEGWYMNGTWYDGNPEVIPPVLTVNPEGPYVATGPFTVTLSAIDAGGQTPTIYYTLDGSTPDQGALSAVGNVDILVESNIVVKAYAVNSDNVSSAIQEHHYTIDSGGAGDGITVYFMRPSDWASTIRIHHWNALPTGAQANTAWPGTLMDNEEDWYSFTFNPSVTSSSLIFNDGNGRQTADLNRDKDGWYYNGQWYDSNPVQPGGSFTVYFQRPSNWGANIRIHHWNAQPQGALANSTWPGQMMQVEGNNWFSYTFNDISSTSLIFNDGNRQQTIDLARSQDGWYMNGAWYDEDPRNENPVQSLTVFLKTNWANPTMHYWNVTPSGAAVNTTWPGVNMSNVGNGWWSYTIDNVECANMVFSNNGSSQTPDLSRCDDGWYMNGNWYSQNPEGSMAAQENVFTDVVFVTNLGQNYPNPVSSATKLPFSLAEGGMVNVELFNEQGKLIQVLQEGNLDSGKHELEVQTSGLNAGVYFYRMTTGKESFIKRMVIIR